jgi:hypothetical protein
MPRRSLMLAAPWMLATTGCVQAQVTSPRATLPPARPLALPPLPGGKLEPLGGLIFDNAVLGFGGLSGLHLTDDLQLTAIADVGRWLTARLVLDDRLRPLGLAELRSGPLRDGAGAPLPRGFAGDAEGLARLPNGEWLVGFERWHRLRSYARLDGPARYVAAPPELAEAPGNGGLESLAVLADGRWLMIAEGWNQAGLASGARRAWLGGPERGWVRLGYRTEEPMDPCDAHGLPDGGALVLERSFSVFGGFRGRLVRLSARQLAEAAEGSVLAGEEVLRLEPPLPTDNYEGVAVARHGGRSLVALVSDDNQNMLQRTLLLLFALADE